MDLFWNSLCIFWFLDGKRDGWIHWSQAAQHSTLRLNPLQLLPSAQWGYVVFSTNKCNCWCCKVNYVLHACYSNMHLRWVHVNVTASVISTQGLSTMMPPVDTSPYCLLHNLGNVIEISFIHTPIFKTELNNLYVCLTPVCASFLLFPHKQEVE